MKQLKKQLLELLQIVAPSGKEKAVVDYVKPVLEKLCDNVFLDRYGNLLAEKKVGDGCGATVVLSAHMDTVSNIVPGREVIWCNKSQTFRSSKGVLGADDRAGIAIILAVLRNIDKTSFRGTIKVCFSREEEIGCVGAEHIPFSFYKDADLAIVVDRRGNRDIVTGCGHMYGFCSREVGKFFEDCSALLDMNWRAVPGGVSDALVFSDNGINAVNLSAGYMNEHTSDEFVHLPSCRDTVHLILQAMSIINDHRHKFGEVPNRTSFNNTEDWYWNLIREYEENGHAVFYEEDTPFGYVEAGVWDGFVSIEQKGKSVADVFMSESEFQKMIDLYCLITGYKTGSTLVDEFVPNTKGVIV